METEKQFEFKKLSGGRCAFVMRSKDIERTEVVSEEFAKEHYKGLRKQKNEVLQQLSQANKSLEANKVDKNEDVEKFIELANLASKYKKYLDASENSKSINKMLDEINQSMIQIEKVMPEVKRMKS